MQISYKIAKDANGGDVVAMDGPIDEHLLDGLRDLAGRVGKQVVLDLSGIQQINSIGVRSWLEFMRVFGEDRRVRLKDCSADLAAQMAMIPGVMGEAAVDSFYVSLFCADCSTQGAVLLQVAASADELSEQVNSFACPSCSEYMEPEDDPENLIHALKSRAKP